MEELEDTNDEATQHRGEVLDRHNPSTTVKVISTAKLMIKSSSLHTTRRNCTKAAMSSGFCNPEESRTNGAVRLVNGLKHH